MQPVETAEYGARPLANGAPTGATKSVSCSRELVRPERHIWDDHRMALSRHLRLDGEDLESVDGDAGAVMAKLIYASNMSLDGCTEDERGAFDWAPPDDEVFVFITELMGSAGTYLYGRRMYETLAVWETDSTLAAQSELMADYASAWQAADKVVYSSTLAAPLTANTRLERRFDPRAVHDLKAAASRDLLVGGPNLAGQALVAGLVDELALFVWPVVLGGRNPALPTDSRADLELIDEHRFGSGVVYVRYRLR
jgi:dihydrofolate reductase